MAAKRKGNSPGRNRKVRVDFRRNRNRPAREKDWTQRAAEGDQELLDASATERVVAKGSLSRKRTVIEGKDGIDESSLREGIVVAMRGLIAEVDDGSRIWPCTVRRILRTRLIEQRHPVTTGDRVLFSVVSDEPGVEDEGVIEKVSPRKGELSRMVRRRKHTIVANVDQAIVVASAGVPAFKPHLIDRYIVAAHDGDITPVICLNKIDLDVEGSAREHLGVYESLGYRTLRTCAISGQGIEELQEVLRGRCSVMAGQSGVGKSSLLNAADPSLNLRTGGVNVDIGKGRHVTTTAILIRLGCGGYVVDTPGVKSFDLSAVDVNDIEAHMREFADHIPHCKFADCTHRHEIGCAVKAAVDTGEIHPIRYESFVRMFEERLAQMR